jgi:Ca2+-binding EF-hand superfamily protein
MKARQALVALLIGCGTPAIAAPAAQDTPRDTDIRERQVQLRRMDTDNDGVITRAEWRGSTQAFRTLDTNNDGVLSGYEIWADRGRGRGRDRNAIFDRADRDNDGVITRSEWSGDVEAFERLDRNNDNLLDRGELRDFEFNDEGFSRPAFSTLDRNNNGVITSNEWTRRPDEFRALDSDNDGVLTEREYRSGAAIVDTPAYRAGRERGLADGRQAGREDKTINGGRWDLDGQRELETADAGYNESVGPRTQYQAGYRAGFRAGYREGFGPRQ